nr:6468_t:CDS:2 [Entrophospora candida]
MYSFERAFAMLLTTLTNLFFFLVTTLSKKKLCDDKMISLKCKKWAVNSAITQNERLDVYFVDPSEGNRTIIEKINEGTYLLLYGPRASGKSTRILHLQEQLEENGYACIYVTFEEIDTNTTVEHFWSQLG